MNLVFNRDEINTNLIGLGIFLGGRRPSFKKNPILPEVAFTSGLEDAKKDLLLLSLMRTWIIKNHNFISVEILKKIIPNMNNQGSVALLMGLLKHSKDKRFESLYENFRPVEAGFNKELDKMHHFSSQIGQTPYDKHWKSVGLDISELELDDDRKFFNKSLMLELNPFLKNRQLFGTNSRADVATLMELGCENPSQIRDILSCAYETAHRNFNSLSEAGWAK